MCGKIFSKDNAKPRQVYCSKECKKTSEILRRPSIQNIRILYNDLKTLNPSLADKIVSEMEKIEGKSLKKIC